MIADILQFRCFIHHINKDLLHEIHIQLKKYFDIQDATINTIQTKSQKRLETWHVNCIAVVDNIQYIM